jgi:hypothetical protein
MSEATIELGAVLEATAQDGVQVVAAGGGAAHADEQPRSRGRRAAG